MRGGSSTSSLTVLPNNCALFKGHLDIETLGGAGFASQFQSAALQQDEKDAVDKGVWNLSAYDGLEIDVGAGDGKVYTLIVKDQQPQEKRHDGRKRADINWEAELRTSETGDNGSGEGGGGKKFWVPWTALKPTYRGKEKENAGELKTDEVRRIGFMMRRYVCHWKVRLGAY